MYIKMLKNSTEELDDYFYVLSMNIVFLTK